VTRFIFQSYHCIAKTRFTILRCLRYVGFALAGGLIGVGTKIDPTLTRADRLVGQVLGSVGKLPAIFSELEISFFLLRRLLGVKTDGDKKKQIKVWNCCRRSADVPTSHVTGMPSQIKKLSKGEILMVNIGSTSTGARVLALKNDLAKVGIWISCAMPMVAIDGV